MFYFNLQMVEILQFQCFDSLVLVAIYKWNIRNGKIEIISIVVKVRSHKNRP